MCGPQSRSWGRGRQRHGGGSVPVWRGGRSPVRRCRPSARRHSLGFCRHVLFHIDVFCCTHHQSGSCPRGPPRAGLNRCGALGARLGRARRGAAGRSGGAHSAGSKAVGHLRPPPPRNVRSGRGLLCHCVARRLPPSSQNSSSSATSRCPLRSWHSGGAIFAATLPAGRWCGAPRSAASETALSSNTFMRPTEILSPPGVGVS